jgi:hypothetical protein
MKSLIYLRIENVHWRGATDVTRVAFVVPRVVGVTAARQSIHLYILKKRIFLRIQMQSSRENHEIEKKIHFTKSYSSQLFIRTIQEEILPRHL